MKQSRVRSRKHNFEKDSMTIPAMCAGMVATFFGIAILFGLAGHTAPLRVVVMSGLFTTLIWYAGVVLLAEDALLSRLFAQRYWFALAFFGFLILNKVHFSSIGMWETFFPTSGEGSASSILFGRPRDIRSDEWLVNATEWIGQNSTWQERFTFQNILNPMQWGAILFGPEYGFSWLWCLKLVAMVMSSLEFAMLLTGGNKRLSLVFALFLACSPGILWWSGNLYILYAQTALVSLDAYLRTDKTKRLRKSLFSAIIALSAIGFALSIYPAWQVPWFYFILIMVVCLLKKHWQSLRFDWFDWVCLATILLLVGTALGEYLVSAREAIRLTSETVYPGNRVVHGGGENLLLVMNDLTNFKLPFAQVPAAMGNNSEASSFIGFTGFLWILLPWLILRGKVQQFFKQSFFLPMTAYYLFMLMWIAVPFPLLFAKLTFLQVVTSERMVIPATMVSAYLFLTLSSELQEKPFASRLSAVLAVGVAVVYVVFCAFTVAGQYLGMTWAAAGIAVMAVTSFLSLKGMKRLLPAALIVLSIISGMTVNPVSSGAGSVVDRAIYKEIKSIQALEPEAEWVGYGNLLYGQYLKSAGVHVVNAVQQYPDRTFWHQLDQTGINEEIYNRYAHITVFFTKGDTSIQLLQADSVQVSIRPTVLESLGVRYVMATEDLTAFNNDEVEFTRMPGAADNVHIFQVTYP